MSEPESIVFVFDDDPSARRAINRLIGCVGLQVELFGSAKEFLASNLPNPPSLLRPPYQVAGNQRARLGSASWPKPPSDSIHHAVPLGSRFTVVSLRRVRFMPPFE
jgi:hypothetical protein